MVAASKIALRSKLTKRKTLLSVSQDIILFPSLEFHKTYVNTIFLINNGTQAQKGEELNRSILWVTLPPILGDY